MKITFFVSWVMLTVTDEIQIKERNHNIETVPRSAKTATNSTKWETCFFTGGRWLLLHGVSWKRNEVCRYKIFNCQWMTNLLYDNLEMFCSEIALCRPGGRKRSWCSVAESSGRMSCQLQFPLCCASSGLSELREVRCGSWNGDRQVTFFCDSNKIECFLKKRIFLEQPPLSLCLTCTRVLDWGLRDSCESPFSPGILWVSGSGTF